MGHTRPFACHHFVSQYDCDRVTPREPRWSPQGTEYYAPSTPQHTPQHRGRGSYPEDIGGQTRSCARAYLPPILDVCVVKCGDWIVVPTTTISTRWDLGELGEGCDASPTVVRKTQGRYFAKRARMIETEESSCERSEFYIVRCERRDRLVPIY